MVKMVETMLDLKKRHAVAENQYDDSRHDLARQIERLDRDIDHLVYIIEGRAATFPT
jgi:hypothetical protein